LVSLFSLKILKARINRISREIFVNIFSKKYPGYFFKYNYNIYVTGKGEKYDSMTTDFRICLTIAINACYLIE